MDVIAHFACHTRLPVHLRDIREHILDHGYVDSIAFIPADLDKALVQGFVRIFKDRVPYSQERTHAKIFYSRHLDLPERRVVITKEMLHLVDGAAQSAATREAVSQLVTEMSAPFNLAASLPGVSDQLGLVNALLVLMPRDALDILREHYAAGRLSIEAIANLAVLPEGYVQTALSPHWTKLVSKIV